MQLLPFRPLLARHEFDFYWFHCPFKQELSSSQYFEIISDKYEVLVIHFEEPESLDELSNPTWQHEDRILNLGYSGADCAELGLRWRLCDVMGQLLQKLDSFKQLFFIV